MWDAYQVWNFVDHHDFNWENPIFVLEHVQIRCSLCSNSHMFLSLWYFLLMNQCLGHKYVSSHHSHSCHGTVNKSSNNSLNLSSQFSSGIFSTRVLIVVVIYLFICLKRKLVKSRSVKYRPWWDLSNTWNLPSELCKMDWFLSKLSPCKNPLSKKVLQISVIILVGQLKSLSIWTLFTSVSFGVFASGVLGHSLICELAHGTQNNV